MQFKIFIGLAIVAYEQLGHAHGKCFGMFLFSFLSFVYFGCVFDQAIIPAGLDVR